MSKEKFLLELRAHLLSLPEEEINEIVRDLDEYIYLAMSSGRTEQEVIASLGEPKTFAKSLIVEHHLHSAEQRLPFLPKIIALFKAIRGALTLAPLNMVFLLTPCLFMIFLIIFLWLGSVGLLSSTLVGTYLFIFHWLVLSVGINVHIATLAFLLGITSLGFLSIILAFKLTRFFTSSICTYIKWQLILIKSQINDGH